MGDCDVERFIFPDGTERDMLVFDNRSAAACAPPRSRSRDAHVCPLCGSALVHPTDWRRTTAATWRITLRCPNCETIRTLTLTRTEVERLNKALYEGTEQLARQADPQLTEGVYAGLPGPHYETPAEVRMLRKLGADMVGMSTVHETIAARAAGAEVLGVSLVTNLAAGIAGHPLSHAEVLAAGAASASRMGALLALIIERIRRF